MWNAGEIVCVCVIVCSVFCAYTRVSIIFCYSIEGNDVKKNKGIEE